MKVSRRTRRWKENYLSSCTYRKKNHQIRFLYSISTAHTAAMPVRVRSDKREIEEKKKIFLFAARKQAVWNEEKRGKEREKISQKSDFEIDHCKKREKKRMRKDIRNVIMDLG